MMNHELLHVLEFDRIQAMLAEQAPSALSKEMAARWEPSADREEIERLLRETDEASVCAEKEISLPLGETRDMKPLLERAEKEIVLRPQEFMDLCVSLETYDKMARYFTGDRTGLYPLLAERASLFHSHAGLVGSIRRIFEENGDISDQASPRLHRIRSDKEALRQRIRRSFQKILQDSTQSSYFQEALITQREGRYVIPVKAEYRYQFKGIVHDRSSTGQTLFMEPMISVELNNDLAELEAEEKQEIREILRGLTRQAAGEGQEIADDCRRAADIEFIFARAFLALKMKGVKALLSEGGTVRLLSARHPLLDPEKAVPLSLTLGEDFRILVITGSNTGGKTVALKTLGLLALMNQAGLFIPAMEGTVLPVFPRIYAVIGDDQSIQENLSTFSAYMTQLIRVLRDMSSDDLVLLDELGSGTDPVEGAALAQAVTEEIHSRGGEAVITSHFSELKKLAYATEGIENAFVEFDEETMTPTYRLMTGMAGSSNAFRISRRLGMPPQVLARAEALKEQSPLHRMDAVMEGLNRQIRETEEEKREAEKNRRQAEQLRDNLSREWESFREKKKKLLDKAREDAEALRRNLRVQSEEIIRDLKKQASEMDRNRLQEHVSGVRRKIDSLSMPAEENGEAPLPPESLHEGMPVYIDTFDSEGVIRGLSGDRVTVSSGGMMLTVRRAHCFPSRKKQKKAVFAVPSLSRGEMAPVRSASQSLNIIGRTVDEAIPEVDRFLNDAVMAGLSPVQIIHGKGTGALRRGIQEYLGTLPFVKEYHTADARNGGAGVTEVFF